MAEQDRKSKRATEPARQDEAPAANPKVAEKGVTLEKSIDRVLDEIDNVLEENAEEFVST